MAFLAPLAPLVLPALLSAGASYGVGMYMQSQAKKNSMAVAPPPKPKAAPPQSSPVSGDYVFENSQAAVATGGDSAIDIDPLGKRGSGAAKSTTMLGR